MYSDQIIQKHWEMYLLNLPDWEPYLMFGSFKGMTGSPRLIEKRIKHAEKLGEELIALANRFDFDILKPKYSKFLGNDILTDTGKINSFTAEFLLNAFERNNQFKNQESDYLFALNSSKIDAEKRDGIPIFIAKAFLVGIRLHGDSFNGIIQLKKFIEPGGGLENWINSQGNHAAKIDSFIVSTSESFDVLTKENKDQIRQWALKKRQILERSILSRQLKKEIKLFADVRSELASLRTKIKETADSIVAAI